VSPLLDAVAWLRAAGVPMLAMVALSTFVLADAAVALAGLGRPHPAPVSRRARAERRLRVWSSLMTRLGLLGTLIGLVGATGHLGPGETAGLLGALGTAYGTTIVGIVFSVIADVTLSIVVGRRAEQAAG
jgi:hypothetical protein